MLNFLKLENTYPTRKICLVVELSTLRILKITKNLKI